MSEEDEVFLERSFQRTLIVSYDGTASPPSQILVTYHRADAPRRSWRSSSHILPPRLRSGGGRERSCMPTPSSARWSVGKAQSSWVGGRTSTGCSPSLRECRAVLCFRGGFGAQLTDGLCPAGSLLTGRTFPCTRLRTRRKTSSCPARSPLGTNRSRARAASPSGETCLICRRW